MITSDINLADNEEYNDAKKIFYPIGYYYTNNHDETGKAYAGKLPGNVFPECARSFRYGTARADAGTGGDRQGTDAFPQQYHAAVELRLRF